MSQIVNSNGTFNVEDLCGYLGAKHPDMVAEALERNADLFQPFQIVGDNNPPPCVRLWDVSRAVLGKDIENYAQQIGDCHPSDTIVDLAGSSSKYIQDVEVGDFVRTPFSGSKRVVRTIEKDYSGPIYLTSSGDRHAYSTPDHKFLLNTADSYEDAIWSSADSLSFAHKAYEADSIKVYCLEVEDDHSFFANGLPVHNCVSFGMKNAVDYVQCLPIANGTRSEYHDTFPPYYYGISRVQIGGGGGFFSGDGSVGAWAAAGVVKYGVLRRDFEGVPAYSGSVAKSWGRSGPPQQFIAEGSKHLIKSAAQVKSADEAAAAIKNGYPVTIASNFGFTMSAGSDGFYRHSTRWDHQMCLTAVDTGEGGFPKWFGLLNSWADQFGVIKDFRDPSNVWPTGMLRIHWDDADQMIKQGDSFAVSTGEFFPAQPLPDSIFSPW